MEALAPSVLLLTHFGFYTDTLRHIAELREHTTRWSETVRAGLESGAAEQEQIAALEALAASELDSDGEAAQRLYGEAASVEQCWQGLARYWRKRLDLTR